MIEVDASFHVPEKSESPLLSRSNSSYSTDVGYASGSAGSSPLPPSPTGRQESATKFGQDFVDGAYPVPLIVVRDANGFPEHFPLRIRNTFLDIKTPGSNVELEERIVRSCPVSRMVSACSDRETDADAEVFIPKPSADFEQDFCDTLTEVWEDEQLHPDFKEPERLAAVRLQQVPVMCPGHPATWMHHPFATRPVPPGQVPFAAPVARVAPVSVATPLAAPFQIPCVASPMVAPPQLRAPNFQVTNEPPPAPCFSPGDFAKAGTPRDPAPVTQEVANEPPPAPCFSPGDFAKAGTPRDQAPSKQEASTPPPPATPPQCDLSLEAGELPSVGSAGHANGNCKPCAFLFKVPTETSTKEGCESGMNCNFCHLCPPGEKKRRRKVELAKKA
ncbi:unnamed protein product [Cladocopium goreaui]|uniref:Ribosomal RNA large subunit methyltransferase J n=1 Tax=Cladocopium goreaui TaxID=2562237 RepID=A0A9P1BHP5_9DINO|nr:unnamed protein product [Cladocopium goreaui]